MLQILHELQNLDNETSDCGKKCRNLAIIFFYSVDTPSSELINWKYLRPHICLPIFIRYESLWMGMNDIFNICI